jgi:hypothetical protein
MQLSKDVWGLISDLLPGPDRAALRRTCRALAAWVDPPMIPLPAAFHERMMRVMERRGINGFSMANALTQTGASITGSLVLQAILDEEWPSDVDIVGSVEDFDPLSYAGRHNLARLHALCVQTVNWDHRDEGNLFDSNYLGINMTHRDKTLDKVSATVATCERIIIRGEHKNREACQPDFILGRYPGPRKGVIWRVLQGFDLSCCRCLWDGSRVLIDNRDILRRRAGFNKDVFLPRNVAWISGYYVGRLQTPLPHIWRRRVLKYRSRGFTVTGTEGLEEMLCAETLCEEGPFQEFVLSEFDGASSRPPILAYICAKGESVRLSHVSGAGKVKHDDVDLWEGETYAGIDTRLLGGHSITITGKDLVLRWSHVPIPAASPTGTSLSTLRDQGTHSAGLECMFTRDRGERDVRLWAGFFFRGLTIFAAHERRAFSRLKK